MWVRPLHPDWRAILQHGPRDAAVTPDEEQAAVADFHNVPTAAARTLHQPRLGGGNSPRLLRSMPWLPQLTPPRRTHHSTALAPSARQQLALRKPARSPIAPTGSATLRIVGPYSANVSDDEVSHGTISHRYRSVRSRWRDPTKRGCGGLDGYRVSLDSSNYMSLYELDWDGDDFVTTLYSPAPEVTLSGCSASHFDDESTSWEDVTSSTDPGTGVTAQFRMQIRATRSGCCSNW